MVWAPLGLDCSLPTAEAGPALGGAAPGAAPGQLRSVFHGRNANFVPSLELPDEGWKEPATKVCPQYLARDDALATDNAIRRLHLGNESRAAPVYCWCRAGLLNGLASAQALLPRSLQLSLGQAPLPRA